MDLVKDAGLINIKSGPTPMVRNAKFNSKKGELITNPNFYMRLIGKLLYLCLTRLAITFSIKKLS